jgi:Swt1-like HEPN
MTKAEDHFRSFGMSGFIVTEELRSIEERYDIELGHVARVASDQSEEYYPQFEQAVRAEAALMSRHYEVFYCLENAIRKLIDETLGENVGEAWWESGKVPPQIADDVKSRIQKETDSGVTRRSDAPIDYTTFGELSGIIIANWDLFGAIFSSRRAVEKVMNSLNVLRGPIAHCCLISDDEILRLRLAVRDWFRITG